jgi:hypothetical protein
MRFSLRLPQHQARLVALAVSHHLARPGAELDADTMAEYAHGLAELPALLDPQLDAEEAALELRPLQVALLSPALASVISELKMYSILDTLAGASARPRSTAAGFDDRLRTLFPQVAGDSAFASQLAEDTVMLRRLLPATRARELLEGEKAATREAARGGKRWQFWKRWTSGPRTY